MGAHSVWFIAWYSNILLDNQMNADKRDSEKKTGRRIQLIQSQWDQLGNIFLFPRLPWKHSSWHTIKNSDMVMRTEKPPRHTFRSHCFFWNTVGIFWLTGLRQSSSFWLVKRIVSPSCVKGCTWCACMRVCVCTWTEGPLLLLLSCSSGTQVWAGSWRLFWGSRWLERLKQPEKRFQTAKQEPTARM